MTGLAPESGPASMSTRSADLFAPAEMAARAADAGAAKTRLGALSLFTLAILARAFIALGAQLATVAGVGATGGFGPTRLMVGVAGLA